MRAKKKSMTNKPEVEAKETRIVEEVVAEVTETKPELKEEVNEEIEQEIKEMDEEKPAPKKRGRAASKEVVPVEEASKKRGRKSAAKPAVEKKPAAKKAVEAAVQESIVLQFAGKEISTSDIINQIKAIWVEEGHRTASIKKLELYIKPEEFAAYYVINEKNNGKIDL